MPFLLKFFIEAGLFKFQIKNKKDEFFAQVPQDVVERLVVRPEDLMPQVDDSIKSFKEALLHVLEVNFCSVESIFFLN